MKAIDCFFLFFFWVSLTIQLEIIIALLEQMTVR